MATLQHLEQCVRSYWAAEPFFPQYDLSPFLLFRFRILISSQRFQKDPIGHRFHVMFSDLIASILNIEREMIMREVHNDY